MELAGIPKEQVQITDYDPDIDKQSARVDAFSARLSDITEKIAQTEKEILWLLYQKYSRRKIAEMRFSSEETIKIHIKHILRKLNFSNVAEMLIFLREIGIMELLEKQQQMFDKKE